jgi:RNA polymerase sigma-70 factor (ECF subfamily)
MSLSGHFLNAVAAPRRAALAAMADLEGRLLAAWQQAQAAWPQLPDDPLRFVDHLASVLPYDSLDPIHAADLHLACHCGDGHDVAMTAFLAGPFTVARRTLGKLRCPADLIDEVEQRIRAELLVARPGERRKISAYAGRGTLESWIASIAARSGRAALASELRRSDRPNERTDMDVGAESDDPELAYVKDAYRDVFAQAVTEAMAALETRERNLLRQHHLDALTLDELATLYGVHRATLARWLKAARDKVADRTRVLLRERIYVGNDEFDSIVRLVESQVHVSVARLLDASH